MKRRKHGLKLLDVIISIGFAMLIVIADPQATNAQWSTSGNNVYKTNTAGNVGIGTNNNPGAKLDVAGNVQISSNSSTNYVTGKPNLDLSGLFVWHDNATKNLTPTGIGVAINRSGTAAYFTNAGGYSAIFDAGNVGIGTTSPNAKLHLTGPTSGQIGIRSDSTTNNWAIYGTNLASAGSSFGIGIAAGGNSSDYSFGVNDRSNTLNYFYIRGDGNVGIGTASPGTKLNIATSSDQTFRIDNTTSTYLALMRVNGSAAQFGASNATAVQLLTNDVARVTVLPSSGNVGIGKINPDVALDVVGDIKASGVIYAKYQDVAEWVPSSEQLAVGTVVVLDSTKSNQVTSSTHSYDTRVAGVVSEKPGLALGEKSDSKVLVATTGRVRVKVDATKSPIQIGDLLVTSDIPGVAMKSEAVNLGGVQIHRPGTLIGKALEPLAKGKGEILVLLSLQ